VYPIVEMDYTRREEGYLTLGQYFDGANADKARLGFTAPVIMRYPPQVRGGHRRALWSVAYPTFFHLDRNSKLYGPTISHGLSHLAPPALQVAVLWLLPILPLTLSLQTFGTHKRTCCECCWWLATSFLSHLPPRLCRAPR
jgi:hypothetical protein